MTFYLARKMFERNDLFNFEQNFIVRGTELRKTILIVDFLKFNSSILSFEFCFRCIVAKRWYYIFLYAKFCKPVCFLSLNFSESIVENFCS